MKLINDLVSKIGTDKVLHFLVGYLICSCISIITILQDNVIDYLAIGYVTIGTVAVVIFSFIKEYIDDKFDKKDILASVLGCIPVYVFVTIGILFYMWSN